MHWHRMAGLQLDFYQVQYHEFTRLLLDEELAFDVSSMEPGGSLIGSGGRYFLLKYTSRDMIPRTGKDKLQSPIVRYQLY